MKIEERGYQLRCLEDGKVRLPEIWKKSCQDFSYNCPKQWKYLPSHVRKTKIRDIFKDKLKDHIWEEDWEAVRSEKIIKRNISVRRPVERN